MVTYSVNVGLNIERLVVAEETISSAGRILQAAGFDLIEISHLFRKAADQIDGQESEPEINRDLESDDHDAGDKEDSYSVLERYEQIDEIKALKRIGKRLSALDQCDDEGQREKAFDYLKQALPLAHKAFCWLLAECSRCGIETQSNREEWLKVATDDDLDREDSILFLDDWNVHSDFQFGTIQELARAFSRLADDDKYNALLSLMSENTVLFDRRTMDEVTEAGEALRFVDSFAKFLSRFSGSGEQARGALLDEFVLESGFSSGTYILEGWLDSLQATGHLQLYKRANRWRLTVN